MDVLRKELNAFYDSQDLQSEQLDFSILEESKNKVATAVEVESDCRVITDASADFCYIFGGKFSLLLGLSGSDPYFKTMTSSDEDEIYDRIHPEDLVDKRMLEYEFFKFVDSKPASLKLNYKATCRIRLKDNHGKYLFVENSTRILKLSPKGKVWLILCCYDLSPAQTGSEGISPRIIDCTTGEINEIQLSERRSGILTKREKEILALIKEGKPSKQIADILGISLHTVNRHRQNILEKLSVGNSVEAVAAASMMRLL